MAIATVDQICNDVKKVLPIYDDDMFDEQLEINVGGAMHKLEIEGIPNVYEYGTIAYKDYLTCVRYQVAVDMDLDVDLDKMKALYITRANTLRCSLSQGSN